MTALDVLDRAVTIAERGPVDCPYCALADAKTELGSEREDLDLGDLLEDLEIMRQVLMNDVRRLESDQPLEEAMEALKPFRDEIAGCPSPVSAERCVEILRLARNSAGH